MPTTTRRNASTARATRTSTASSSGDSQKRSKFVVKVGHSLTVVEGQGDQRKRAIKYAGDEVELSADEADRVSHALEPNGTKAGRPGQVSRLQRRIKELEAQLRDANAKSSDEDGDDEQREAAVESIRQRGDNFKARGEPDRNAVPSNVVDAYEEGLDQSFARSRAGQSLDDETDFAGTAAETERRPTSPQTPAPVSEPQQGGGK